MMKNVLTCSQVAQRIGYDKETVRRWCRDGVLPAFKLGVEWLIEEKNLTEVKTKGAVGARPE